MEMTGLQARLMGIPQVVVRAGSDKTEEELVELKKALRSAAERFGIEGVVHGGIRSVFQKKNFEAACSELGLAVVAPLWGVDEAEYLREIVRSGFRFIVTSVTAQGLDDSWLGREITEDDAEKLIETSSKFGLNASFEGGEAETFVTACPLFAGRIRITKARKTWDGYRGRFEISDAVLEDHC